MSKSASDVGQRGSRGSATRVTGHWTGPYDDVMNQQRPTALIGYSHDDAEHEARVLELANRLRSTALTAISTSMSPGWAPPEGWPRWMLLEALAAEIPSAQDRKLFLAAVAPRRDHAV